MTRWTVAYASGRAQLESAGVKLDKTSIASGLWLGMSSNGIWSVLNMLVLLEYGIGLWDVVAEARRVGSLDSRIRERTNNDLIALIETLPNLVAVAFNGGTAAKIGERALGERIKQFRIFRLPSSSPAYAAVPYSAKLAEWEGLRDSVRTC